MYANCETSEREREREIQKEIELLCLLPSMSALFNYRVFAHLTLHWIRIQLAHIAASIILGDGLDVQIPGVLIQVADRDSWIVRNDVLVYGLNGFRVGLQPAHLWKDRTAEITFAKYCVLRKTCAIVVDYCYSWAFRWHCGIVAALSLIRGGASVCVCVSVLYLRDSRPSGARDR